MAKRESTSTISVKLVCEVCGRRVAKTADNWDHSSQGYIHTKCWFKKRNKESANGKA